MRLTAVGKHIPGRVVHVKGAGAYGEFVVTHDVTDLTSAAMLVNLARPRNASLGFRPLVGREDLRTRLVTLAAFLSSFTRRKAVGIGFSTTLPSSSYDKSVAPEECPSTPFRQVCSHFPEPK